MSIPFFSIDFKKIDWLAYLKGTIGINFEKSIDALISNRFPNKKSTSTSYDSYSSSSIYYYWYIYDC